MQSVAIFPITSADGEPTFRAVARTGQSEGRTPGAALDAISSRLASPDGGTVVVIQTFRPDELFTAGQQSRLQELMGLWRVARDAGQPLTAQQQTELRDLIEAELRAADARTKQVLERLGE